MDKSQDSEFKKKYWPNKAGDTEILWISDIIILEFVLIKKWIDV